MDECSEVVFDNLPNFRQAGGKGLKTSQKRRVRDGLLFRSSRTDFLNEKEAANFTRLGIRAIIDLRRKSEYERSDGDKILDGKYTPCVIANGKVTDLKPSMRWGGQLRKRQAQMKSSEDTDSTISSFKGRRYLVNMWTMDLIWYFFTKVNFFVRYLSLILVLVDWLFGCHYFVRFFFWAVMNRQSMAQQYVDVLEYTKGAVVDIMRVVSDGDNLPVLIHCAHGKDRTGLIIAVILSCLGVDDEVIAEDYAKSESGLACIRERVLQETVYRYGVKTEFTKAEADTMREVLAELRRRYGSVSQYLVSAGFAEEEQEKLRAVFFHPKEEEEEEEED